MKKLFIAIPILLLAAACNKQTAPGQPVQNQPVQNQEVQTPQPAQVEPAQIVTPETLANGTPVNEAPTWKTYMDDQHGIQFQFFEDVSSDNKSFVVSDGRSTGNIVSVEKDGVEAINIGYQNNTSMSSIDCAKNLENQGQITIAGISTNKCFDKTLPGWNVALQKKVSNGFDVFTIYCSNEHSDFEAYCEKVLSTFKFTN